MSIKHFLLPPVGATVVANSAKSAVDCPSANTFAREEDYRENLNAMKKATCIFHLRFTQATLGSPSVELGRKQLKKKNRKWNLFPLLPSPRLSLFDPTRSKRLTY